MLATVHSSTLQGIDATIVEVEVDVSKLMPKFTIVGLPDTAIREARERVEKAVDNSEFEFPGNNILVNLAPASLRKQGSIFDLAIAVGILKATGQLEGTDLDNFVLLGELSLDGGLRPVRGALSHAMGARAAGITRIILPAHNAREASMVPGLTVLPACSLEETVSILKDPDSQKPCRFSSSVPARPRKDQLLDLRDVRGQENTKRALEIAAAGGHNILLSGPPGSGKTMLARRITAILPEMTTEESIETTRVHSICGLTGGSHSLIVERPFCTPHHTASTSAIVGGGSPPHPGEVSLAHNGILFLDEFPEFAKNVLQVLRQPMEDGCVTIARATGTYTFPSRFMLVASMNPCPCGHLTDPLKECVCTPPQVAHYLSKISGPIADRIDIQIDVPRVAYDDLAGAGTGESSEQIRARVQAARNVQIARFRNAGQRRIFSNAGMVSSEIRAACEVDTESRGLLRLAVDKLGISARAYDRILKISRTIADLEGSDRIRAPHISEAIQYRGIS